MYTYFHQKKGAECMLPYKLQSLQAAIRDIHDDNRESPTQPSTTVIKPRKPVLITLKMDYHNYLGCEEHTNSYSKPTEPYPQKISDVVGTLE